MSLDFYRAFEDRHRGTRESILERQRVYLPFLEPLVATYPGAGVVDVGCGRGEWLELLRNVGVPARGADLDEGMLAACRERGLDVQQQDAVAFLRGLPDASSIAVSGFHLAEHLPFDVLQELVHEALRVVKPGGLLILETPNPENLVVGTASFYLDPTHQRPLPSALLEFMAEHTGFARVKVMRLQEPQALHGAERLHLMDVLGGASPDYAIVAQKEWAPEQAGMLDHLFAQEFGLKLDTLAARYDRKLREDIHLASVNAAEALASAESARAAVHSTSEYASNLTKHMQAQVEAMQHQVAEARHAMAQELQAALQRMAQDTQLAAIYNSRSWRVTAPLRAAMALARQGRDSVVAHLTPERVEWLSRLAQRAGLHAPLRRFYHRFRGAGPGGSAAAGAAGGGASAPVQTPGSAQEESLSASERRALQLLEPSDRAPAGKN